jgi:hypothetical protein
MLTGPEAASPGGERMPLFSRTRRERDINSVSLGKAHSWKLARGEVSIRFHARLLGFYHLAGDCQDINVQNQTHLETIAIFKTSQRYLVYYQVNYLNNEYLSGHHVFVRAVDSLEGASRFIQTMDYVNKKSFAQAVVEDAAAQDL